GGATTRGEYALGNALGGHGRARRRSRRGRRAVSGRRGGGRLLGSGRGRRLARRDPLVGRPAAAGGGEEGDSDRDDEAQAGARGHGAPWSGNRAAGSYGRFPTKSIEFMI